MWKLEILPNTSTTNKEAGFTLLEALISIVVVAYAAVVLSGLFMVGLQMLGAQDERVALDAQLRSRMEILASTHFDQLVSGTDTVTLRGLDHTLTWTVANVDLDGDTNVELAAKTVILTMDGRSLSTIMVDHWGRVGKL